MNKPILTKKESDIYMKIATQGTMDDMFDLGYAIGRERSAKEWIDSEKEIREQLDLMTEQL